MTATSHDRGLSDQPRPLLVDVDYIARVTPIPKRTIYALMDSGVLPSKRVGRRRYVRPVDLDEFVNGPDNPLNGT